MDTKHLSITTLPDHITRDDVKGLEEFHSEAALVGAMLLRVLIEIRDGVSLIEPPKSGDASVAFSPTVGESLRGR